MAREQAPRVERDPFDASEPDLADLPDAPSFKDVAAGLWKKMRDKDPYE
jgi:hypothetical protein